MLLEPPVSGNATTQYAIQHASVLFGSATTQATMFPTITTNTITGFIPSLSYAFSNTANFEPKKGIWCNLTANNYVTCNNVSNVGRGFEFSGYNQFAFWRLNNMTNCGESFALTNTGIMGTQGNTGGTGNDGCDNQWNISGFADTYADATSNPASSILYVETTSNPAYFPTNNLGGGSYFYQTGLGSLVSTGSTQSMYQCGNTIAGRTINPIQGNATARTTNSGHGNSASSMYTPMSLMEEIVQDSLYYASDSAQNSFINKNIVYRTIKQDTTQMTGSVILHNFYTASQTTCRQLFCVIDDSLNTGNYSYANILVSGFTPSCIIEQNYKRFYQIIIDGMQNVATSADSTDLETLASSCPMLNGEVVYNARAFHNSWYKRFKHYEDNCPAGASGGGYRKANTTSLSSQSNPSSLLTVYPNPNNGRVYVSGFDAKETSTNIEVTDVTGKLVYKQQSNIGNGVVELNLQLISGVYFVHIINAQGATQIQKIVINN